MPHIVTISIKTEQKFDKSCLPGNREIFPPSNNCLLYQRKSVLQTYKNRTVSFFKDFSKKGEKRKESGGRSDSYCVFEWNKPCREAIVQTAPRYRELLIQKFPVRKAGYFYFKIISAIVPPGGVMGKTCSKYGT